MYIYEDFICFNIYIWIIAERETSSQPLLWLSLIWGSGKDNRMLSWNIDQSQVQKANSDTDEDYREKAKTSSLLQAKK